MGSMATIGNIKETLQERIAGNQISCNVWLIHVDQVDESRTFPSPNINREIATIPLKLGERMHRFQAVADTIKEHSSGERGDITTEVVNSLELVMGGDMPQLYNFMELYSGAPFIIIYSDNDEIVRRVAGTKLRPMILKSSIRKRDAEMTAITFRFENIAISFPKIYVGAIINNDPVNVPVDAISLNLTRGRDQYLIPENTSIGSLISVTGIDKDMYGKCIEILGGSLSYPTRISGNDEFILINKTVWESVVGNSIIFRILDSNTLVEVGRNGSTIDPGRIWHESDDGGIWHEDTGDGIWHP
ncbi:MAG: hypothetical protein V2B15_08585 [Bacteroidota bacterium]